jgi:hypothetical protein
MPGFYVEEARSAAQKVHLQHYWVALNIGPINPITGKFLLQDVTLPSFETEPHLQNGASLTYKYASFVKYSDATITFYDTTGLMAKLEAWRKKIWTPDAGLSPKKTYAENTVIMQQDGEGTPTVTYELFNTWPLKIDQGPLTYTKSESRIITLTLACDYMVATG